MLCPPAHACAYGTAAAVHGAPLCDQFVSCIDWVHYHTPAPPASPPSYCHKHALHPSPCPPLATAPLHTPTCEYRDPILLPFVHSGMGRVMPYRAKVPGVGHTVHVAIGEPIDLSHITCRCYKQGELGCGLGCWLRNVDYTHMHDSQVMIHTVCCTVAVLLQQSVGVVSCQVCLPCASEHTTRSLPHCTPKVLTWSGLSACCMTLPLVNLPLVLCMLRLLCCLQGRTRSRCGAT
jgi:hypothetical protein